MRGVNLVACALCLFAVADSVFAYEIQLDWKYALLPCFCRNGTLSCVYRRKVSIEEGDVCDSAATELNFYNNLFRQIPLRLNTVISVNASRNRLDHLPRGREVNTYIKVLDVSRNQITNATDELRNLSSLETLDVSVNELTHLRFLPESCALKHLDASQNMITDLEGPLSQCAQLRVLNLNSNKLTGLANNTFNGMNELEVLRLDGNSVGTALTSQIFDNLTNLKTLSLYNIDLRVVPRGIFKSLSKLEELDIGNNDLSNVPEDLFFSLSNLKTLGMTRANMETFPTELFSQITQLETLHLSVNFFTTLPSDAFGHLPHLKTLTLNFVNATSIPENIFTNLSELEVLSLSNNHLVSLPDGLFSNLRKLKKIDLSANRWTGLPLQNLMHVKELFLGELGLNSLHPRMFNATPSVTVLGLYHNNISTVADHAFHGLRLEGLTLSHNVLNQLSSNVFRSQTELKFIDLSHNLLNSLPETIFAAQTNLRVLELAHNKLETLSLHLFQQQSVLEVLDLSDNLLTSVTTALFNNLRSLRKLSLERNLLTELPSVWHAHAALLHVSFRGNAISNPSDRPVLMWLSGEDQSFVDLSENDITPESMQWLTDEPQLKVRVDAAVPCVCGFIRHRRAMLRVCVNSTCTAHQEQHGPFWADTILRGRTPY